MPGLQRSTSSPDLAISGTSDVAPGYSEILGVPRVRPAARRAAPAAPRRARAPSALRRQARAGGRMAAAAASADPELAGVAARGRRTDGVLSLLFRVRRRAASVVSHQDEGLWVGTGSVPSDACPSPDASCANLFSNGQVPAGARRRLKLKCLEFDTEGVFVERYLTRQEIIDEAMVAAGPLSQYTADSYVTSPLPPTPRVSAASVTNVDVSIDRLSERRSRALRTKALDRVQTRGLRSAAEGRNSRNRAFQLESPLTMRDIRQVDPAFTAKAALWVRQDALVVSLESVRAIILHNKMYLFDPDNPAVQRPIRYIQQRLADGARNVDEIFVPFELRALEGILINCCVHLERSFAAIEPKLLEILRHLPTQINTEHLEQLRSREQKLNHFYARSRKVRNVLQTLLDEDADMAGMYLTEKRKTPDMARNPVDHDEAEMLLESYLQVVDDLTNKAELLNRAIDDTENLIEIHLDTMQNQLLLVNLLISVISTIFAVGTLVSSIFGMNLPLPDEMSALPSSKYYFIGCSVALIVAMPLGLCVLMRWSRRQGLYSRRPFRGTTNVENGLSPAELARQKADRLMTLWRSRSGPIEPVVGMSTSSEFFFSGPRAGHNGNHED